MAAAPPHARHPRHPATEAGLWLLWITARISGLGPLVRAVHGKLSAIPWGYLAGIAVAWCGRHGHAAYNRAHRAVLRIELAAADLLTGPVPDLLDAAGRRLRARRLWLYLGGATALTLLHLAIR